MFLLFVHELYESRGGWEDFVAAFATIGEAEDHEVELRVSGRQHCGQIVEVASLRVVSKLDTHKTGKLWTQWEHRWTRT